MTLDTAPLGNAVQRLREGLVRYDADRSDEHIRDGLIQRFEFTYELSHRMLRRYLREIAASPDEVGRLAFADLIRAGNAQGLLRGDWAAWRRYREMRTRTSHTDDAKAAEQVVDGIPGFLAEAEHLYAEFAAAAGMTRPGRLVMTAQHRRLVLDIISANLPPQAAVWVFGSRAVGRAGRYSDLDLAIDCGRRLTLDEIAILAEALSDSDLPYPVDLVDWHAADDRFRRLIAAQLLPLREAAAPPAAAGGEPGPAAA